MKKQLLNFLVLLMLPISILAQDGYSFTLTQNGNYSFSVAAVSNYDSGTFTPLTESYGFTIVVPDGVTITVTDVQPSGTVETISPFSGTAVSSIDSTMADKDLFLITTTTNATNLPSHLLAAQLPLVTFTVDGTPVTGNLTLLDNGSTLANGMGGSLDSFIQVDVTDDSIVNFINGYLGQTGITSYGFDTLGTIQFEELGLELYPNPTDGKLFINGNTNKITRIEVYNLTGQRVLLVEDNFNEINLSALDSAVYMLKILGDNAMFSSKVIKK